MRVIEFEVCWKSRLGRSLLQLFLDDVASFFTELKKNRSGIQKMNRQKSRATCIGKRIAHSTSFVKGLQIMASRGGGVHGSICFIGEKSENKIIALARLWWLGYVIICSCCRSSLKRGAVTTWTKTMGIASIAWHKGALLNKCTLSHVLLGGRLTHHF